LTPLLILLAAGAVVGALAGPERTRWAPVLVLLSVLSVIFAQGGTLGGSEEVAAAWGATVLHSLAFAVATSAACVFSVEAVARALRRPTNRDKNTTAPSARGDWREPARILGTLVLGVGAGRLFPTDAFWSSASTWTLFVLLFVVGLDLGRQRRELLAQLRAAAHALWIVPVTLLASGCAGMALAQALPYSTAGVTGAALANGWYSIAGPMLADLESPAMGAIALLGNLFREVLAMVLIPMMAARGFHAQSAAAFGGATAMDTTLPFVLAGWGQRGAVTALGVGVSLSVLSAPMIALAFRLLG
jgi:uncharacterized membrane protein YbjE (DUF340 family)